MRLRAKLNQLLGWLIFGAIASACGSAENRAGQVTSTDAASSGGNSGTGGTCPQAQAPVQVGALPAGITEASGLVASRSRPNLLYTHNDSGDAPRGYAITETGVLVARIELVGALSEDWEDLAIGPGSEPGRWYLYFGDIGDNLEGRNTSIAVHRAQEPVLDAAARDQTAGVEFNTLFFRYPDRPHNAEALFVDPRNSDLYFVTKGDASGSGVYLARAPHSTEVIRTLEFVTSIFFGAEPLFGSNVATGADMAADASGILIRSYDSAFLWPVLPGDSVAKALAEIPCRISVANESQGEAIAFAADGSGYYTVSEGIEAPVSWAAFEK
jgi:hypothetical protein